MPHSSTNHATFRFPFHILSLSLLLHLLLDRSYAQEVDAPIQYNMINKNAKRCVHEEFINNRICTQESAKDIAEVCTDEYFAMIDGSERTSTSCGGGSKFECENVRLNCKDVATPRTERIPCCTCVKVNTKIKKWVCGASQHSGYITKEVIDFCHPALEYRSDQFRQAMDDDVLPGAGFCENNFAAGDQVLCKCYIF